MKNNFSENILSDDKLKKLMKRKDFNKFLEIKNNHLEMDHNLADKVAMAIKNWAINLGATHYTHWFFPLTGKSAEKQVSFIDADSKGSFINSFSGSDLIKGETDASSFPSGSERMTFEARGYTVWDYSSPVFVKKDLDNNTVLYIPTAFCSYHGVALDEKTPLLRAMDRLDNEATLMLHLLGFTDVKHVNSNLGAEQEYFLINEENFKKRKDLMFTGRTLLGKSPTLSQDIYHHYYNQIEPKISSFMHELDKELWSVGIMAKIQHNEVAPSQHEIVPIFSTANIATDQNSLLMDIMTKIATKHGYKVLFHEKPFDKINGSGKHVNWSLATDAGLNLLNFNKAPSSVFLLVFTAVLAAIDKHYDLLRLSAATYANDFRLGGNEAPPSIISVFIGDDMLEVLNNFIKSSKISTKSKTLLDLKAQSISKFFKDNCDRNRTSPFAFTGNKFEFRMVGSSQSTALPNIVIATIVADEFRSINEKLTNGESVDKIIKNNIKNHFRIIFNGNSYTDTWKKEAEKRGLVDIRNSVDAYNHLITKDNIDLFEKHGVLSRQELEVRYETYLKNYSESGLIECQILSDIVKSQIIPSLQKYLNRLLSLHENLKNNKINDSVTIKTAKQINEYINIIYDLNEKLENNLKKTNDITNELELATFTHDTLLKNMQDIRDIYDTIEHTIPTDLKPFPTYDDILF